MGIEIQDWAVVEQGFDPQELNHTETIFTIGNGYLSTRGAFEEPYPGEMRATFLHGVFDDTPVVFTELANAPDWLEMEVWLAGERFAMNQGQILSFERTLNLKTSVLTRTLRWQSPRGKITRLMFERFASLEDEHLCVVRVSATPENFQGKIEFRSGINSEVDNLGLKHWEWLEQGVRGDAAWLHCRTRASKIDLAIGIRLALEEKPANPRYSRWDVRQHPSVVVAGSAAVGQTVTAVKWAAIYTSRDGAAPLKQALRSLRNTAGKTWAESLQAQQAAWAAEWERCDITIEGDPEAQLAVRFNLFQLLVAAPRHDEHVNLGAKTLSGYGYRGHAFWDTEIFMLPFFTYTRPEIARNLLSYRWHNLAGARVKAQGNGYLGAQYPWESAATGEEVTPTWVTDPKDRTQLIRIWTGDIEVHISSDIAYAIWQYWKATGDETFFLERGAEVILDTARFWSTRAEWRPEKDCYEITNIIGPDEYHDHVDNNGYTNAMARWNLQTGLQLVDWLKTQHPEAWRKLNKRLRISDRELVQWQTVINKLYIPFDPQTRLMEQFEGYFYRKDIDLAGMEPRDESIQSILGIEGVNQTQVLKQPDVLMLFYLLPGLCDEKTLLANYAYYTPRTDHTFGSSLGPSIQAIMACRAGDPAAYEHFMRAARADLFDVRNNAGDGIHGASAGGLWQAVVFGFAGLERGEDGWQAHAHLPKGWTRLSFQIMDHGQSVKFDLRA